jgi:regulator of PEP synthase PpsR (kinase-PPPase family)
MDHEPRFIDVLSDSTGETAERVMRAALLQFPQSGVEIRRHARVRTKKRAEPILRAAAADGALLIFSVVSPELSHYIHEQILTLQLDAIDVIGSVIDRLETYLARKPINRPGAQLPLGKEYFRRIEAVEFTVKSDAGRDPRNFLKADLVLVGVSRTSKTPLATLRAQRGLKVANLTLALNVQPPAELHRTPSDRIVGLTIDVDSLCAIRQERLRKLGMPQESQYGVRTHVTRELAYAEGVFADNPEWPVVDMTGRSVEETAGIILELMSTRLASPRSRVSDLGPKPQGWPTG